MKTVNPKIEYQQEIQDKRLEAVEGKVNNIVENHLPHIQEAVNRSIQKIDIVQTDVAWIKRFFWIMITASIGSFVAAIFGLLFKK